ncbi:MAG: hypothetical protein HKN50_03470 [Gammaproteobacteria bacterium]|nr:hypothetical protein [Gammaproteobacteria bacterium]
MVNDWSGQSALQNIDQSLQGIRNDVVRLDRQLTELSASVGQQERRRVALIKRIVQVRLRALESEQLLGDLSSADRDALALLEQREAALGALNLEIDEVHARIQAAEAARGELLIELNRTSERVLQVEAEVQQQLQADQPYLAAVQNAANQLSMALEAADKVKVAQADMADKAKPYQADVLFMYLWNRGYGTTAYAAGPFARWLDGKVARLIDYEPARVNFWNLTEIPKRLQEHADAMAAIAETAREAVIQLEQQALAEAGIDEARELAELATAALDDKDDELERREDTLQQLLRSRNAYLSGQDEYLSRCISRLGEVLQHADLATIQRYVRDTPAPSDDAMVLELQDLDGHLNDVAGDLRDLRSMHDARLDKLKQLQQVRRNFKDARFDDLRSVFGNTGLLSSALSQFLAGAVNSGELWRILKRNQRYREGIASPDFGSGSLGDIGEILGGGSIGGKRNPRSPWPQPGARRGGGGFRIPRASGRSRGGFKTGGSF